MPDLYSDVASFGVLAADIRLIIIIVISVIMIIIGISIVAQKVKRSKIVSGTITNSNCIEEQNTDSSGHTTKYYNCTITVKCNINGTDVTPNFTITSFEKYVKDQKIDLYYDPNDITNINTFQDNYHFWGWLIIIIAI